MQNTFVETIFQRLEDQKEDRWCPKEDKDKVNKKETKVQIKSPQLMMDPFFMFHFLFEFPISSQKRIRFKTGKKARLVVLFCCMIINLVLSY